MSIDDTVLHDSMTAHPDVWLLVPRLPAVRIAACRGIGLKTCQDEEEVPSLLWRAEPTLAFTMIDVVLVSLTGLRFLLYPPLVVMTYEMFSHLRSCPWAPRLCAWVLSPNARTASRGLDKPERDAGLG